MQKRSQEAILDFGGKVWLIASLCSFWNFEILLCNNVRTKVKQCLKIQLFVYHYFSCLFTFVYVCKLADCLHLQVSSLFTFVTTVSAVCLRLQVYICKSAVCLHLQVSCLFTFVITVSAVCLHLQVSCLFTFTSLHLQVSCLFTFVITVSAVCLHLQVSCLFTLL